MIGSYVVSGVAGLVFGVALVSATLQPQPFVKVDRLESVGDMVYFTRTVTEPNTIVDWSLTIITPDIALPPCHGGLGWTEFTTTEPREKEFTLAQFLNWAECPEDLAPGDYVAYMTWRPRDGRPPVSAQFTFTTQ